MLTPLLLLAATAAGVPQDGEPARVFSCEVVATADPALEDRWNHVASAEFHVQSTTHVYRGQLFGFFAFFEGYGLNERNEATLTYAVRITRPDGKVYHESEGHRGWNRAVRDPENVLLAQDIVRCAFEPGDPFGKYTATIRVADGITGATAEAATEVELVKYAEGPGFGDAKALDDWIHGYAGSPEPARIVPGVWTNCRNDGFSMDTGDQVADGFFIELLDGNDWLFPELFDGFKKRTAVEKRGALWLLAHSSADSEPFVKKLSKQDQALWAQISSAVHDPMTEPLRERHDLNELWGRYIASRRLAPLKRLVLSLHEDGGAISSESVRSSSGIDVPLVDVIPGLVGKTLRELFASNPLARAYAEALLRGEALPEGVAGELTELLGESK